jgi:hypothetical protein
MTCYIWLADWMHEEYEKIAKEQGWKTQENCRVKFEDLPKENQKVMLELAKRLIKKYNL